MYSLSMVMTVFSFWECVMAEADIERGWGQSAFPSMAFCCRLVSSATYVCTVFTFLAFPCKWLYLNSFNTPAGPWVKSCSCLPLPKTLYPPASRSPRSVLCALSVTTTSLISERWKLEAYHLLCVLVMGIKGCLKLEVNKLLYFKCKVYFFLSIFYL